MRGNNRGAIPLGVAAIAAAERKELDRDILESKRALLSCLSERISHVGASAGQKGRSDTQLRRLRSMLARMEEVDSLIRAFQVQTHPEFAPSQDAADAAIEEMISGIEALWGLELEARSSQARLAMSATVLEYSGGRQARPSVLTFRTNSFLAERFKRLNSRVRAERQSITGHSEVITPEDLLNMLVAMGECNESTLARMGSVEISMGQVVRSSAAAQTLRAGVI